MVFLTSYDCDVRPGILYLKRLNIVLDLNSGKGFGLVDLDNHFLANIALNCIKSMPILLF